MSERQEGVKALSKDRIRDIYFKWMVRQVDGDRPSLLYLKLLRLLHETDFFYILDMDENCAGHGMELRDRFAYERQIPEDLVAEALDDRPCSVLEMMVSLALRCEEHITSDPDFGNRTSHWFFEMVDSLGLSEMDNKHFDRPLAEDIIFRFLSREYAPNGVGGLFTIHHPAQDLREVDIWSQMMWYLNDTVYNERRTNHD